MNYTKRNGCSSMDWLRPSVCHRSNQRDLLYVTSTHLVRATVAVFCSRLGSTTMLTDKFVDKQLVHDTEFAVLTGYICVGAVVLVQQVSVRLTFADCLPTSQIPTVVQEFSHPVQPLFDGQVMQCLGIDLAGDFMRLEWKAAVTWSGDKLAFIWRTNPAARDAKLSGKKLAASSVNAYDCWGRPTLPLRSTRATQIKLSPCKISR